MNRLWLIPAAVTLALVSGPGFAQSAGNEGNRAAPNRDRLSSWTPAAMERARQVQLPTVSADTVAAATRGGQRASRPANPGSSPAKDLVSDRERSSGNVYEKPLYWAGKLFFRAGGENYVCSAQFISPTVLLTAAHCVRDAETGEWHDDLIFALQYKSGEYSQVYDYVCAATNKNWVQPGFEKYFYDFAVIKVDKPSKTGYFGTHWDWQGQYNDVTKIGYPGGVENGEVIQVEKGPIQMVEGVVQLKHGNPADQGGSSGGAWIGKFDSGNNNDANYIISVESFGIDGQPGIDYGPYLNDDFKSLWDYGENGCQ
ncbi:MAG: trypsin-like serine protease [Bauldia sp.]|uniref:trypsin-like serine peptidase n=1 Tax=Bauldia sp. TaxID=2575872 RepID=UPI001DF1C389|nr:trypsin-like serine protease [Bauldia sp.]MCB1496167.1 trypsin-like serine protease [Bauldia sp.]